MVGEPKASIAIADFYTDLIEDPIATREAKGVVKHKEVEMIRIRWAGDTKRELHAFATAQSDRWARDPNTGERTKLRWCDVPEFMGAYQAFKAKEAQRVSGTPIEKLPFLNRVRVKELELQNVFTIEQLLLLDGAPLAKLGMGARELQSKARDYMKRMEGVAIDSGLRDELAKRDAQMADMQAKLDALMAAEQDKAPAKTGKKPAAVAEPESTDPAFATFNSMTDDELRGWLTDAGQTPHNRCGHATLVRMAVETNASLKAQAEGRSLVAA